MRRIEVVISLAVLAGLVLLLSLVLVIRTTGMPNIITCLEEDPKMDVEVQGHVVDREVFGCAVYWYAGRHG
jgi:hypothetical protein